MTQTVTASKSELAYAHIHDRIIHHEYSPGYRLVLGTIADELQMSVVPVREAIRRLEAEGYVTFERNVGARVAVPDESEYVHTMQVLSLVEGSATAEAAPARSVGMPLTAELVIGALTIEKPMPNTANTTAQTRVHTRPWRSTLESAMVRLAKRW